jgi:hypothetical protein
MNDPIEPLAHEHDDECECKERQSINVTQPQIVGEKITHVRAKNTGEAERGPVSGAQRRKVDWLHGDPSLAQRSIAIDIALGFSSGRIDKNRRGIRHWPYADILEGTHEKRSGISMIPAVKHSDGSDCCEHRLPILKGI